MGVKVLCVFWVPTELSEFLGQVKWCFGWGKHSPKPLWKTCCVYISKSTYDGYRNFMDIWIWIMCRFIWFLDWKLKSLLKFSSVNTWSSCSQIKCPHVYIGWSCCIFLHCWSRTSWHECRSPSNPPANATPPRLMLCPCPHATPFLLGHKFLPTQLLHKAQVLGIIVQTFHIANGTHTSWHQCGVDIKLPSKPAL